MAAAYFRIPELALEKEEAKAVAEAIAEVNRHYAIPGINPAHASIASLIFIVTVTYAKRVPYVMARRGNQDREGPAALSTEPPRTPAPPDAPTPSASDWFAAPVDAPIN